MDALVTVILPTYNASATLSQTMDSTLAQTHRQLEVLVLDDGSTDDSPEIARSYALRDDRVRCVRLPHQGLATTLNQGLAEARGDWIARMDADDIMAPQRLERQLAYIQGLARPHDSLLGAQVEIFPRPEKEKGWFKYETWLNDLISPAQHKRDLFIDAPLAHPTYFAHRAVFERLGGYRVGPFTEDYDLLLRADEQGIDLAKIPEILLRWREHSDRLTHTCETLTEDGLRRLKVAHLVQRHRKCQLGAGRPWVLWGVGPKGKRWLRNLLAEDLPVSSAVDIDPKKIGRRLRNGLIPVREISWLAQTNPRPFVLLTVGLEGVRAIQRAHLEDLGWVEGDDFLAVQ
jgi:hypothetical protein